MSDSTFDISSTSQEDLIDALDAGRDITKLAKEARDILTHPEAHSAFELLECMDRMTTILEVFGPGMELIIEGTLAMREIDPSLIPDSTDK